VWGTRRGINPKFYPDHGRCGDLSLQGKISTAESGIEPGTPWLVARCSDHQATRLVIFEHLGSVISEYSLWDMTPCTRGDQTVDRNLLVGHGCFLVSIKMYLSPQYDE
jgi:hypothetical protein